MMTLKGNLGASLVHSALVHLLPEASQPVSQRVDRKLNQGELGHRTTRSILEALRRAT